MILQDSEKLKIYKELLAEANQQFFEASKLLRNARDQFNWLEEKRDNLQKLVDDLTSKEIKNVTKER